MVPGRDHLADLAEASDGRSVVCLRPLPDAGLERYGVAAVGDTLADRVVEVTGAGDAFAAGYLAATVLGWPARARLRLGHLMGSRTVGVCTLSAHSTSSIAVMRAVPNSCEHVTLPWASYLFTWTDQVPALAAERDQQWVRVGAAVTEQFMEVRPAGAG